MKEAMIEPTLVRVALKEPWLVIATVKEPWLVKRVLGWGSCSGQHYEAI